MSRRRLRTSLLAAAPGMVLIAAAIVSTTVHVGLGVWGHDEPLGYVNPDELGKARPPVRMLQAKEDIRSFTRELTRELPGESGDLPLDELNRELDASAEPELTEWAELPEPEFVALDTEVAPVELGALPVVEIQTTENDVLAALSALDLAAPALDSELEAPDAPEAGAGGGLPSAAAGGAGGAGMLLDQVVGQQDQGGAIGRASITDLPTSTVDLGALPEMDTLDLGTLSDPLAGLPGVGDPLTDVGTLTTQGELVLPIHLDHAFDYVVHRYSQPGERAGYFRVTITPKPRELQVLEIMPKDVVFLLDTSSSIPGSTVNGMADGVSRALATLNPGDRFNIALFNDQARFLSEQPLIDANAGNLQRARAFLDTARSDGSYTDVNAAVDEFLNRQQRDPNRVLNLIVISDGKPTTGTVNTRELINRITADNDGVAAIHCVGVTEDPNEQLLDFLSYRNGGGTVFALRSRRVSDTVFNLCQRLRAPLIRDVRLNIVGRSVQDVHPIQIPNIHQGEAFEVFGRFETPGPFTIQIAGVGRKDDRVQPVDFTFVRDLAQAPPTDHRVRDRWSFWKLHHLYSEQIRRGSDARLQREIDQLERRR